jgi:LacI family gluconate utilization system Gnt-I transcriptional repressor
VRNGGATGRDRRPSAAVTLTEVARKAGVGESTASRVLRRQGSVSEETRARVLKAAKSLGYVPNRLAGSLASTGSNLVGIIVPSLANILFPDVLRGANAVLESEGFHSVIGVAEYDAAREESLIESLLSWRPSALMVVGLEHTERARAMLRGAGIRIAELYDIDGEGIDIVVGFSNRAAGAAAAKHLLARGYRRIAYIGADDMRASKRLAGFADVLKESGLALIERAMFPAPSFIDVGRAALASLLERNPTVDAVYFSNDDMAIGGYFHCLASGIDVPGRLALFGHNGLEIARCVPQPLSTIRTPRVAIGELSAKLVGSNGPSTVIDLGFELVEGGTT